MKTSVLYLGLQIMHMMYGILVQPLILLMEKSLKNDLFETAQEPKQRDNSYIHLYKIFEFESKISMIITPQLEKEYCCFYHFLLGKRRVMEKANKINVN